MDGIVIEPNPEAYSPIPEKKNAWRAFWDFFVLFSGISTASNLTRTQSRPVRGRGLFLFRTREKNTAGETSPAGETLDRR
jgi:hypothetical protein